MSDITIINDTQQSQLVTNGLAKNGELYLKAAGSTDAGSVVVYDSGAWRTFANDYVSGLSNQYSVNFDGANDYIAAVSDPGLDIYSLSFWFKTTQTNYNLPVSGFGYGGNSSYGGVRLNAGAGRLIEVNNGVQYIAAGNIAASDFRDGAWHNITIVYVPSGYTTSTGTASSGGKGYKIFLDGTRVDTNLGSTSHTYNLMSTTSTFKAGREGARNSYFFQGLMDELAIFGSSLSDSDVTAIYNSGAPADLSSYSPTLWWRMGDNDGGTGTTITDQGSGSTNGTLTNGPTFSTEVPS